MVRNGRMSVGWNGVVDHLYHRVANTLWWAYEATLWVGIATVGFSLISQPGVAAKRQALTSMVTGSQSRTFEVVPQARLSSRVKFGEKTQTKK